MVLDRPSADEPPRAPRGGVVHRVFLRPADGKSRAGWRFLLFVSALSLAGVLQTGLAHLVHLPSLRGADGVVVPTSLLVRGLLSITVALGVTALLLRFVERRPLSTVGLPLRSPWVGGVGVGLLLGAATVALLVGALAVIGDATVTVAHLTAPDFVRLWLPAAIGLALVSASEELLLRGYGLQLLSEAGGRWFAAGLTGVLFGAMHVSNPGASWLGIVNTAVNAILLAWLIMRTGSLWIACGYHAGWNLAGAPLFGMRLSGIDHATALLSTRLTGPEWLSGGAYGFEGSVVIGFVELVVLTAAVGIAPRLPGHPELRPFFGGHPTPPVRAAKAG